VKRWLAALQPYVADGARTMLLVLLSLAAAIFLLHAVLALSFRYSIGYGEAPLVDQAMRLASGQNIFRSDLSSPPYTVSNYPPLYPLLVSPFVKLFGPSYLPGRIISLLSTLASGVFLALIVHIHSHDRLAAAVTTLLFLAIRYVVGWSPAARVDMLAMALSTAALYVVARWPTSWRGVLGSSLLLVAAVYTRQSHGLAAPLAAFVWLLAHDWRQALRLRSGQAARMAALVGGVGLVLFVGLNALTQGGFYFNIVTANVNEFDWERVRWWWRDLRETASILLVLGGVALLLTPRRVRAWPLLVPYLIGSCLSALTIGKIGSSVNYLLELCAALCLVAGILLAWSRKHEWLRASLLILLTLQAGQLIKTTLNEPVEWLKWRLRPAKELEDLEWIVQTSQGPVLADEFMGMLTLNGQPLYIQPFEVTRLADAGLWDQTDLLTDIRNQEFPAILIYHCPWYDIYKERWTPEMISAIMDHYAATDFLAQTVVFRPRDGEIERSEPSVLGTCPGAPWRLPTRGEMGMWWLSGQLSFMGGGHRHEVPVYAVEDGLLMRLPGWTDSVAIQHDDPWHTDRKVWSYYGGMADAQQGDVESFVAWDFPPGTEAYMVKRGQFLGYQGRWSEQPGGPAWVHLLFAVVPAMEDGSFPEETMVSVLRGEPNGFLLDPSPYLGTIRSRVMGTPVWLPLRCQVSEP
jgi:hypothetical protein